MVLETYEGNTFCGMNVSQITTVDGCLPWPTHTFTASDTFTFLLPSGASYSHSFVLSYFSSITETVTVSLSFSDSTYFIICENCIVRYTSYFTTNLDYFTIVFPTYLNNNGLTSDELIGVVVSAAAVLAIVGLAAVFIFRHTSLRNQTESKSPDTTNIISIECNELVDDQICDDILGDKDQWI